jgi:hypothetical protein
MPHRIRNRPPAESPTWTHPKMTQAKTGGNLPKTRRAK